MGYGGNITNHMLPDTLVFIGYPAEPCLSRFQLAFVPSSMGYGGNITNLMLPDTMVFIGYPAEPYLSRFQLA